MNKDGLHFKVGIVVLLSFLGAIVTLMVVGKIGERFEARQIIEVSFPDAQGLKPGAPVLYSGTHIGTVVDIVVKKRASETADKSVPNKTLFYAKVRMDVKHVPEMPIAYGDVITIHVPLAMGDPDIRIMPMGGPRLYQSGELIEGVSRADVTRQLDGALEEIGPLVRNLRVTSDRVRVLVTDNNGVIGVLTSKEVADGLQQTFRDLRGLAFSVKSLGISDVLADNKVADRIVDAWWKENVSRNMPAADVFEQWKIFVRNQKALDQTLIFTDPKYPEGAPWKKEKIREWKQAVAEERERNRPDSEEAFRQWKEERMRREYEQWKKRGPSD